MKLVSNKDGSRSIRELNFDSNCPNTYTVMRGKEAFGTCWRVDNTTITDCDDGRPHWQNGVKSNCWAALLDDGRKFKFSTMKNMREHLAAL